MDDKQTSATSPRSFEGIVCPLGWNQFPRLTLLQYRPKIPCDSPISLRGSLTKSGPLTPGCWRATNAAQDLLTRKHAVLQFLSALSNSDAPPTPIIPRLTTPLSNRSAPASPRLPRSPLLTTAPESYSRPPQASQQKTKADILKDWRARHGPSLPHPYPLISLSVFRPHAPP